MLNTAYALPYALAQPFLGPIGDRFGKPRCIQVCVAGLAVMLAARRLRAELRACCSRRGSVAGIFAGGLIPLVLAGLGDTYDMSERQVMIGRMLFAIISGQMLGSVVSGFANDAFGWRSALFIGAGRRRGRGRGRLAADAGRRRARRRRDRGSFADALRPGLRQPEGAWLYRRRRRRGRALLRPLPVHGRAPAGDHGARRQRDLDRDRISRHEVSSWFLEVIQSTLDQ